MVINIFSQMIERLYFCEEREYCTYNINILDCCNWMYYKYSGTWIFFSLDLHFPWFHMHFYWSHQNMHNKNILFSWNIHLYLPHDYFIIHSIWAQIGMLLGFFKYFIYQLQGKGVFLNTVFNIGLEITDPNQCILLNHQICIWKREQSICSGCRPLITLEIIYCISFQ